MVILSNRIRLKKITLIIWPLFLSAVAFYTCVWKNYFGVPFGTSVFSLVVLGSLINIVSFAFLRETSITLIKNRIIIKSKDVPNGIREMPISDKTCITLSRNVGRFQEIADTVVEIQEGDEIVFSTTEFTFGDSARFMKACTRAGIRCNIVDQ